MTEEEPCCIIHEYSKMMLFICKISQTVVLKKRKIKLNLSEGRNQILDHSLRLVFVGPLISPCLRANSNASFNSTHIR